jgi:Dolichyl-phosphate-mannose-protein mannosyltransferase
MTFDQPTETGVAGPAAPTGARTTSDRWWKALAKSNRLRSILLASAALAGVTYCVLWIVAPPKPVPKPFTFDPSASWITTTATDQSCGCFRLDLEIPGKIANAWVAVATNGGFETIVNGSGYARFFLWRRTHQFQTSLSEGGQKLYAGDPAMSVNYPREYQWKDHDNAELPTLLDLSPYLHSGRNTICVEVECDGTTPAMILSGEVLLESGEKIPIRSGKDWAAEPVPRTVLQQHWTDPKFSAIEWDRARPLPWHRQFWRLVPEGVYEEPFRGKRLRSLAPNSITWVEQNLDLPKRPVDGFLRMASDTPFHIWINGRSVDIISRDPSVLAWGPWSIRTLGRIPTDIDLDALPEWLDPNSVDSLLPGQQPERPPTRDPAVNNFTPDQQPISGTSSHPYAPDEFGTSNSPQGDRPRGASPYSSLANPERAVPPALTRDRRNVDFITYDLTSLLRAGRNTIRIGFYQDAPEAAGLSREPFAAFDGRVRLAGGDYSYFASDRGSLSASVQSGNEKPRLVDASVDGPIERILLPSRTYFGSVYPDRPWFKFSATLFLVAAVVLLIGTSTLPALTRLLEKVQVSCAILAGWLWVGVLARSTMLERSEAMYWRFPSVWLALLIIGLTGAALALILQKTRLASREVKPFEHRHGFLSNWRWYLSLGLGTFLCFGLRAWHMDLQPPDEDEYVSVQASLAVAQTGKPEFQEGVWYTRSPAYHYLAGGIAKVTGSNILALRLLSVLFSCGTALLICKMGEELTGSRLAGFFALVLFAIHPFLVFSGHVARFYQQQQFFHLLGLAFFVRGFIAGSNMRDRYLTVLFFFLAVLSQEITVLQVVPLAICCGIFAQRRPWPDDIRLLICAVCAVALIAVDVAFFKIECMTALEGISPRIDASVGWSFEKPTNFFSLIIGYSRLHLVLSAFLIPGCLVAWYRRQTVWISLYLYFVLSIVVSNLLITSRGYRFEYFLIPVWILLCVHGMVECAKLFLPLWRQRSTQLLLGFGWLAIVIVSWSPWRILNSYDTVLQSDPTRALAFVAHNLRSGDRLAISELYPQAALLETGRSDYDVAVPILYDFALRKKGKLVDRNAAAEVVGNLDELQRAFAQHERLWVVFDRDQMHSRSRDVLWEYPAGRIQLFLRNNARLVFRSYLWSVYLWDRNAGQYSNFREKPGNWFE